jgi:hypothetical protein
MMPRRLLAGTGAALLAGMLTAAAIAAPADEAYLDALRGPWTMTGTVMSQPVRYRAMGERVLKGSFLRLRMIDAARPPQYQAEVFLGYDVKAGDYVVHWLDEFGAAGARVVGTGHRDGERLVIDFPYADGAFHDTFTHDPTAGTWTLLLESREKDGRWSTFASYRLERPNDESH